MFLELLCSLVTPREDQGRETPSSFFEEEVCCPNLVLTLTVCLSPERNTQREAPATFQVSAPLGVLSSPLALLTYQFSKR